MSQHLPLHTLDSNSRAINHHVIKVDSFAEAHLIFNLIGICIFSVDEVNAIIERNIICLEGAE